MASASTISIPSIHGVGTSSSSLLAHNREEMMTSVCTASSAISAMDNGITPDLIITAFSMQATNDQPLNCNNIPIADRCSYSYV